MSGETPPTCEECRLAGGECRQCARIRELTSETPPSTDVLIEDAERHVAFGSVPNLYTRDLIEGLVRALKVRQVQPSPDVARLIERLRARVLELDGTVNTILITEAADALATIQTRETQEHDHETCIREMERAFDESLEQALNRAEAAEAREATLRQEKESDAWHRGWVVAVRERDEARRRVDVLEREIEALRQALKPFADIAAKEKALVDRHAYGNPKDFPKGFKHFGFDSREPVTVQQWLDLHAALASVDPPPAKEDK